MTVKPVKQLRTPLEPQRKPTEIEDYKQAIRQLVEKEAIEKCVPSTDQFLSPYFLRAKKDGTKRFILNLKAFNKHLHAPHFKLEDIRTASILVKPGTFMASLDLKDTYLAVLVHHDNRKYLRFVFLDETYEFTCLPFGLCVSPFVFTKVMKPVINVLRSKGWLSCIYLDDLLCLGDTRRDCADNLAETIRLVERLGFIVNYNKSDLTPSTRCEYLGLVIDSETYSLEPTPGKKNCLISLVQTFRRRFRLVDNHSAISV